MMDKLFSVDCIFIDVQVENKADVLCWLAEKALALGIASNKEQFIRDILLREEQFTTNMGQGVASPHCKSSSVRGPSIIVLRLEQAVRWSEDDEGPVDLVINLAVPKAAPAASHLQLLSQIARKLADEGFINRLRAAKTPEEMYNVFTE